MSSTGLVCQKDAIRMSLTMLEESVIEVLDTVCEEVQYVIIRIF